MFQFYLRSSYLFRRSGENVFFFSIIGTLNTMAIEILLLGILHGKKLNEYKQHSKVTKYLKQPIIFPYWLIIYCSLRRFK